MVGQTVSHYRILERLGAGGMGVVYRADDLRLERRVALKFLPEELTRDPLSMERLLREAKAASALHHQNIRSIFSFDEHEGRQFIVMELLDGQPLDHVIGAGPVALDTLLSLAIQVTNALDVAHARGIIHRDIKPANLFVTDSGLVKVLDFGLAKTHRAMAETDPGTGDQPTARQLTQSGTTLGTAAYMAPEQVLGEPVDQRSDLFSFGSVLYEMATGRQAFTGATLGAIFNSILHRPPAPPTSINAALPASLERVILKALEKDPARRHQSASEIRADLLDVWREAGPGWDEYAAAMRSEASGGGSGYATQAPRTDAAVLPDVTVPRRARRVAFAAAIALAVIGLATAGLWLASPRASYYPCVVIGEFRSAVDDVPAKLIEFQLKRALSQVPQLLVYDQEAYELALRAAARPAATPPAWRRWLPGGARPEPAGPAVSVTAAIEPSLGNISMTLTVTGHGRADTVPLPYKGVNELLYQGIDDMVKRTIVRFHDGDAKKADEELRQYRPARGLLSDHLDAVRSYWQGREAWNHLDLQADRDARRAVEIDPDFALAHLLLGEIRVFQGQMKSAEAEVERARQTPDALTEAERLRSAALLARAAVNAPEERATLQKLIELEPTNREYVFELGESYFHTADIGDARNQYERALRLEPDYALAHNHLGYCYAWNGEHPRALKEFNRYLELDQSPNAWDSLGDAYIHAGEYEKAANAKQQALAERQNLYFARRSLAAIAILTGRFVEADRTLQAALKETSDPLEQARFQASRAYLGLRAGRLDAAAEACHAGLSLVGPSSDDSPTEELLWLQGQIALARGGSQGVTAATGPLARLRQIVEKGRISETNYRPVYKYWLHLAALVNAAEGRKADAAARIDDLEHVRPKLGYWGTSYDQAFFLDAIGRVRETLGDATNAERAYRDALAYNSHYALARFHLAMLLRANGRADEARREFETFLTEWRGADRSVPEMRQVGALGLAKTTAPRP